ncbi:hypothetical protein VP01_13779g1, partial [Puccinia sorghi]
GHMKTKEAPHLLHDLQENCSTLEAAFCLWVQEQAYMDICDQLYKEVKNHQEFYLKEGTFIDF